MSNHKDPDSIALKDIIISIRDYIRYLWQKKWWIGLSVLLCTLFFIWRTSKQPPAFQGKLIYTLNQGNASASLGGVGSLLGKIGLGTGETNELLKVRKYNASYRTVSMMLLDSAEILGVDDLVGNHYIDVHELGKGYFPKVDEELRDYRFPHNQIEVFNKNDLRALKLLYESMVLASSDPAIETEVEDETATITITTTTGSAELTDTILHKLFEKTRDNYIKNSTAAQRNTLVELTIRSDSLSKRLSELEYRLASQNDRTRGLTSGRQLVNIQNLQRDISMTSGLYNEVLRNRESADFLLQTAKPDLSIIEKPIHPLEQTEYNYLIAIIYGMLFGGFLSALGFVLYRAYSLIVQDE